MKAFTESFARGPPDTVKCYRESIRGVLLAGDLEPSEDSLENGNGKVSCNRCQRDLEPIGEAGVSVLLFAQTVGIKPRQKSAARQLRFCPACAVSLAFGPSPDGSLNLLAWFALRELAGGDPALSSSAYQNLHRLLDLPPAQPALDS